MEHTETVSKAAGAPSALNAGLGNLVTEGWMVYYNSPYEPVPASDFSSSGFCTDHTLYKNQSEAVMVCKANGDSYEAKRVAVFEVPNAKVRG